MSNTLPTPATIRCANCDTPGAGRYCGHCGQRLDVHLHSVGHFMGEAAEVLTHSDSSLWNTLWPLLTRPGELTREFIAGRRARHLQPFRLYLVASVLFLTVANLTGPHASEAAKPAAAGVPAAAAHERDDDEPQGNVIDLKPTDCTHISSDAPWMQRFIPALAASCRSMLADNGRELGHALTHNAGRAMFVFLPLLAAFMKLLYWRPKRYYLEHLLLLLHNHAFIYLFFAIITLAVRWIPVTWIASLIEIAAVIYCVRYLFVSMRAYYGQGRALTFAKFTVLCGAYSVAGVVMFLLTAFVTAVTL